MFSVYYANFLLFLLEPSFLSVNYSHHSALFSGTIIPLCIVFTTPTFCYFFGTIIPLCSVFTKPIFCSIYWNHHSSLFSFYYANILLYLMEPTFLSVYYANILLYLMEQTFLSVNYSHHSATFTGANIPLCSPEPAFLSVSAANVPV
jgi:hypothetical protein